MSDWDAHIVLSEDLGIDLFFLSLWSKEARAWNESVLFPLSVKEMKVEKI